jgi:hypothetical protein
MINIMKNLFNNSKIFLGMADREKASRNLHNSQFAALFYIRNTNIELDKDLEEVLCILKGLENLNEKSSLILTASCSPSNVLFWKPILQKIEFNLTQINHQLAYLKENIVGFAILNDFIFWSQNATVLEVITQEYKKLEKITFEIIPESEKSLWQHSILKVQNEDFSKMISLINICKQQFDFTKRFTPREVNTITQTIVKNTPAHYSLDEARKFELDYNHLM